MRNEWRDVRFGDGTAWTAAGLGEALAVFAAGADEDAAAGQAARQTWLPVALGTDNML